MFGRSAHLGFFRQPTEEDREKALACMEEIGVAFLQNKLCNEMSGGELQMVLMWKLWQIMRSGMEDGL